MSGTSGVCSECRHGLDTPNHELRCLAGQAAVAGSDVERDWRRIANGDCRGYVDKAGEYGHVDLDLLGAGTMAVIDPDGTRFAAVMEGLNDQERARVVRELGIAFYLHGKIARMLGAYADGRIPSDDTWTDTTIYSMMGRLNRAGRMEGQSR